MRGSCLCGSVTFQADPPLRDVKVCHCIQCRKTSGHIWAATSVPLDRFHLLTQDTLVWFRSSADVRRGFCSGCGASLFWHPESEGRMAIAPGALDGQSGLTVIEQLFPGSAGDYYAPEGPPPAPSRAEVLHGACLCGANRFTLPGPMGEVWACHCTQCRKTSGHYAASFDADPATITWAARDTRDHVSPHGGIRSFCTHCGSGLTFRKGEEFSIEAGCIDNPTSGHLVRHNFVAEKGDYYTLTDGLPQDAFSGTEGTQA
jgi:hypothetical protein